MTDLNIDYLLVEWGKWSRGGIGGQASANIWVGSRTGFAPDISDDMALRVDAAVVACGVEKAVLRHVLQMYYQNGLGVVDIQVKLRVGRTTVEKYLVEAKGFVTGHLSAFRNAA